MRGREAAAPMPRGKSSRMKRVSGVRAENGRAREASGKNRAAGVSVFQVSVGDGRTGTASHIQGLKETDFPGTGTRGDGAPDYGASGGRTPRICRQRSRSKE